MKTLFFITLLYYSISVHLRAQDFPEFESAGLRIDPLWLHTLSASQFGWANDLQYDAEGNIYCAGYLRGDSQDSVLAFLNDNCSKGCTDQLIFVKYNNQGKREWLISAGQQVRPTALRFAKNGEIYLVGTFGRKGPVFYGTDGTQVTANLNSELESGFFIARYTKDGRVLACTLLPGYELNGFEMDVNGNQYLAGAIEYRQVKDRSTVHRRFLLQCINKEGETVFKFMGDTIGESQCASVAVSGKNIMVALNYQGVCSLPARNLQSDHKQSGALLFFTRKGKLKQVLDSIDHEIMAPASAVYDENGVIYIASGGYNHPLNLYALNTDLSLRWRNPVPLNQSSTVSKLLPYRNKLYVCGHGYGAIFGKNSAYNYVFKAKGSTDVFVAAYKTSGEIEWLKTAGGQSTDFCAGMGICNNQLSLFGFVNFGGNFQFKSKEFSASSTLWLATFALDSLEKVDHTLPQAPAAMQATVEVNASNCTCVYNNAELPIRFLPSAGSFIKREKLNHYFKWKFGSVFDPIDQVFISDFYFDGTNEYGNYYLDAHVFGPVVLKHPRGIYQLDFLPCKLKAKEILLPITIQYTDPLSYMRPSLALVKGDTSAAAIYQLLFWHNNVGHDQLLANWFYQVYTVRDYKPWLKAINKKYKLQLPLESNNFEYWISNLLEGLQEKNIHADTFLLKELVYAKNHGPRITKEEWNNLCVLFSSNYDGELAKLFYECSERVQINLDGIYAYYKVDTSMLSAWNPLQRKSSAQADEARFLFKFREFSFHSLDGSKGINTEFYSLPSKIKGTNARFKLNTAEYEENRQRFSWEAQYYGGYQVMEDLAFGPVIAAESGSKNIFLKLPEVRNFSGLHSYYGKFWLDYEDSTYSFTIRGLEVNNEIIFGTLILDDYILRNDTLFFNDSLNRKYFTIPEIEKVFVSSGFDEAQAEKVEDFVWLRFYRRNKTFVK